MAVLGDRGREQFAPARQRFVDQQFALRTPADRRRRRLAERRVAVRRRGSCAAAEPAANETAARGRRASRRSPRRRSRRRQARQRGRDLRIGGGHVVETPGEERNSPRAHVRLRANAIVLVLRQPDRALKVGIFSAYGTGVASMNPIGAPYSTRSSASVPCFAASATAPTSPTAISARRTAPRRRRRLARSRRARALRASRRADRR